MEFECTISYINWNTIQLLIFVYARIYSGLMTNISIILVINSMQKHRLKRWFQQIMYVNNGFRWVYVIIINILQAHNCTNDLYCCFIYEYLLRTLHPSHGHCAVRNIMFVDILDEFCTWIFKFWIIICL